MKKFSVLAILFYIFMSNLLFINLQSQINNFIVVKVGNTIVTSVDIQNQIITNLIVNKQELTQLNIDKNKNFSVQSLIRKSIKKSEIDKYKITNYNPADLQKYIENVAKNLNTDQNGLKEIFKQANIDYDSFVENYKVELLWNTLIFSLYQNQTNINMVEVNNEIENLKENTNNDELKKLKEAVINRKREEKFQLFSRSHFTNLENTININFQ